MRGKGRNGPADLVEEKWRLEALATLLVGAKLRRKLTELMLNKIGVEKGKEAAQRKRKKEVEASSSMINTFANAEFRVVHRSQSAH